MRFFNVVIVLVILDSFVNCFIGTRKDACKYNLKDEDVFSPSPESCHFIVYSSLFTKKEDEAVEEFEARRNAAMNHSLINCIKYYEKLKECEREENRYMPSIYG
ncbi:hypothetical protein CH378_12380 [Leptospira kmetyi]|uniref:Uncharacterized protein n=1 Tax=Leptospira kmetyi TaxID=408139 RepID=A0ABX4NAA7_9LEPT|nr:hypothetical protein CH378_12380 [Leptospira kmetyi]